MLETVKQPSSVHYVRNDLLSSFVDKCNAYINSKFSHYNLYINSQWDWNWWIFIGFYLLPDEIQDETISSSWIVPKLDPLLIVVSYLQCKNSIWHCLGVFKRKRRKKKNPANKRDKHFKTHCTTWIHWMSRKKSTFQYPSWQQSCSKESMQERRTFLLFISIIWWAKFRC